MQLMVLVIVHATSFSPVGHGKSPRGFISLSFCSTLRRMRSAAKMLPLNVPLIVIS